MELFTTDGDTVEVEGKPRVKIYVLSTVVKGRDTREKKNQVRCFPIRFR